VGLDDLGRPFLRRLLFVKRRVTAAAGDEPVVGGLLAVVVPVPGVMRAGEQTPRERLGHDHLPSGRADYRVQLGQQTVGVAVGRQHKLLGVELVE
jgi:hypothetical protein